MLVYVLRFYSFVIRYLFDFDNFVIISLSCINKN
jgi:hypothetical protein